VIPDLTLAAHRPAGFDAWFGAWCPGTYPVGDLLYLCSRPEGHTGRHASGDGDWILAVWGDPR
jgi:hypothetical protein